MWIKNEAFPVKTTKMKKSIKRILQTGTTVHILVTIPEQKTGRENARENRNRKPQRETGTENRKGKPEGKTGTENAGEQEVSVPEERKMTLSQDMIHIYGQFALAGIAGLCAATDLLCGKIFNAVTVPGFMLGVLYRAQLAGAAGILEALCSAGFTIAVLYPFFRRGGLGAGDIKLLAAVSAFMPSEFYLRCFAGTFLLGAAMGVLCLLWTRGKKHTVHLAVPAAVSVLLYLMGVYGGA